jgi:cytochrome P450
MSNPLMLPVEGDPFNFARYADPYPNYRRVRETTPVAHFCIGAALARMECQTAFSTLLSRLGDLRLASDTPRWRPAFGVRSLETLPVTFSKVEP